jgi:glutathione S-transferase
MSASKPYTLYTAGTPNGYKIPIALEELGLEYDVKAIDISKNEQKEAWFLKINPNGRIPALIDHEADDYAVFESGAILWYLGEKADPKGLLLPQDFQKRMDVLQWLMFQMGGVGPMVGQLGHFKWRDEKIPYAIERYTNEAIRLFQVLEDRLANHEWLAADQFTIADIANFTWVYAHSMFGISLDDKPHVKAWLERIEARPAVQRGLDVPTPNKVKLARKEATAKGKQ